MRTLPFYQVRSIFWQQAASHNPFPSLASAYAASFFVIFLCAAAFIHRFFHRFFNRVSVSIRPPAAISDVFRLIPLFLFTSVFALRPFLHLIFNTLLKLFCKFGRIFAVLLIFLIFLSNCPQTVCLVNPPCRLCGTTIDISPLLTTPQARFAGQSRLPARSCANPSATGAQRTPYAGEPCWRTPN